MIEKEPVFCCRCAHYSPENKDCYHISNVTSRNTWLKKETFCRKLPCILNATNVCSNFELNDFNSAYDKALPAIDARCKELS